MREVRVLGRDVLSGIVFILIGGFGLYEGQAYRVGTALDMGPGYIPRLLCWLMIGFGILTCAKGLLASHEHMPRIYLRPLVFVVGGVLLFAVLLSPLGLLIASGVSVIVASIAAQDSKVIETIVLAVGLATAAALLFVVALGLPIYLWPW